MKSKIFIISLVLVSIFTFSVSAQDKLYSINVPKDFCIAQKDNNIEQVSKKLGLEPETLNDHFNKNGLIYLAVSSDAKTQIRLSAFSDNFSSEIGDISYLGQNGLKEFAAAIGSEEKTDIIESNNRKYVKTINTLRDSGGVYTVTQYVTISDHITYYLSCYNDGENTSDEVSEIFKSFNLTVQNPVISEAEKPNFTKPIVLAAIGGVVFLAIAVFMIVSIVRPYLKNNKRYFNNEN